MNHIRSLLSEIENAPVECDGFTRLAVTILTKNNIAHTPFTGRVMHHGEQVIPYHFWIAVDDHIIDYRARMWLGDKAPHGIFKEEQFPDYELIGEPAFIEPLDDFMFTMLNDRSHLELLKRAVSKN